MANYPRVQIKRQVMPLPPAWYWPTALRRRFVPTSNSRNNFVALVHSISPIVVSGCVRKTERHVLRKPVAFQFEEPPPGTGKSCSLNRDGPPIFGYFPKDPWKRERHRPPPQWGRPSKKLALLVMPVYGLARGVFRYDARPLLPTYRRHFILAHRKFWTHIPPWIIPSPPRLSARSNAVCGSLPSLMSSPRRIVGGRNLLKDAECGLRLLLLASYWLLLRDLN